MHPETAQATPPRAALLAGASGLVGREILQRLLGDPQVQAVHALVRRPLDISHPKLAVHQVDFASLPSLPPVSEAYLALGTTIKAAGSQAAFRAVDLQANLAVAEAALWAGVRRIGLVSALGANARSAIFYNRVKGELEEALAGLPLEGLVIARPSFLVGDRQALGQPARSGEKLALRLAGALRPLLPRQLRPIAAHEVAQALVQGVPLAQGRVLLLSDAMHAG